MSGTIAQRPGVKSRGSSQSKYGRQSAISPQSSPRLMAACQNEKAPLSKHDVGADCLDHLHVVGTEERHAHCAPSADVLEGRARRHGSAMVDGRLPHGADQIIHE
ncbi:hypothetical protein [uncultured Novosphingobium sp.]|uniref:hypothetical protein n=1 Tax=uncultured Novosphingobium sp. TaxID=292277 RepID=UPI002594DA16|nr:hypothetical protein [uncultured Novosphingobium sp.]